MKKFITLVLAFTIITNVASADKMAVLNQMQLTMLEDTIDDNTDVIEEPTTNPSNDEDHSNKSEDNESDDAVANEDEEDNTISDENEEENTLDPNEDEQDDNTKPHENEAEDSSEPVENELDDNSEANEDELDEEPIAEEEPVTETPEPPADPIEEGEPMESEKEPPVKPTPSIIDTLNVKNAWSNKTVYLTFDDGPSSITNKVLNLLKKEDIKATFFVTGIKTDEGKALLKRITDEGHVVGNHSYSHNYNYIYKSVDNFFDDLYKNENIIFESTGQRPKIIRFPGGSSNTTTKTEKGKKTLNEIIVRLEQEGYLYFDWNASSGDASAVPATVNQIINNTLTWISKNDTAVVLFHDTAAKTNTLKALPTIIEKLKFLGCKFEVLTTSSPHIAFVKNKKSTNTETVPANASYKERKPPYVIKKLLRLDFEMERRFLESRY